MVSKVARSTETVLASPTLAPQSMVADIDRALFQLGTTFNPMHKDFALDFRVSGARNGYVYLSIALPEGMTRVFVQFLESMHGFFRMINFKAKTAVAVRKAADPFAMQEAEERQAAFRERVGAIYDALIDQGTDTKEAISRTNATLKAEKCPWATYELVVGALRSSGRFRKASRVKVPSNPQGGGSAVPSR